MSNPFASGSNSEPIGGIQPNDGGGGRGGSAFPQTSSGKVSILGVVSIWGRLQGYSHRLGVTYLKTFFHS